MTDKEKEAETKLLAQEIATRLVFHEINKRMLEIHAKIINRQDLWYLPDYEDLEKVIQ